MLRMVCKQPEEFGWPPQAKASHVTSVLERLQINLLSISEVQIRSDISSTFLAHAQYAQQILKASGAHGTFFKVHSSSQADFSLQEPVLVWLPESTSLERACSMLEGLERLGILRRRRRPPHRFAARFATKEHLQIFCKKHSLEDISGYGRWKVYGVPVTAGIPGAYQFPLAQKWKVHVVEHLPVGQRGNDSPAQLSMGTGHATQILFKAVNSVAKHLAASKQAAGSASMQTDTCTLSMVTERSKQQQAFLQQIATPRDKRPPQSTGETPEAVRQRNA